MQLSIAHVCFGFGIIAAIVQHFVIYMVLGSIGSVIILSLPQNKFHTYVNQRNSVVFGFMAGHLLFHLFPALLGALVGILGFHYASQFSLYQINQHLKPYDIQFNSHFIRWTLPKNDVKPDTDVNIET